ncbi:uncharacterized protein N7483_002002 [Penicillium malachiteum]|uniref:uncharacterized protein n=1 Tax=Penicillium malachiteum TaxID=1324776 RepID=UPI0025467315|nr:uncharacterized protein N7483_002002 [Penicillium malachiteum]KAJ5736877.1 hypothetical protein N7483_002002 [Penicillium malachiteum]
MSAAKTEALKLINENGVVVFSKSTCPFCTATKKLLNEVGAQYKVLELDQEKAIQDALQEITGQRTVPNIFIGQKHIGGNSDLQAIKDQLPALIQAAGPKA